MEVRNNCEFGEFGGVNSGDSPFFPPFFIIGNDAAVTVQLVF